MSQSQSSCTRSFQMRLDGWVWLDICCFPLCFLFFFGTGQHHQVPAVCGRRISSTRWSVSDSKRLICNLFVMQNSRFEDLWWTSGSRSRRWNLSAAVAPQLVHLCWFQGADRTCHRLICWHWMCINLNRSINNWLWINEWNLLNLLFCQPWALVVFSGSTSDVMRIGDQSGVAHSA